METLSRDTYLHIRRAQAYQLALTELFNQQNPPGRVIWKEISLSAGQSIPTQTQKIRDFLGVSLEQQTSWKNDETTLKEWRKAIEKAGVFVFKAAFQQKDISGFCLTDEQFPIVYLNNSTTKTRQIFSMMHELSHLLLHVNVLSKFDGNYIGRLSKSEKDLEILCNSIAAELLIPNEDFLQHTRHSSVTLEREGEIFFAALATRYGVSREAILRRFLDQKRVSKQFYEQKAAYWNRQKKKTGGGNWYLNQGAYLSDRFAKEVVARHYRQQISLEQAADFLGIKPKSYAGFEDKILQGVQA
jgi:Zn-dependent peptidase ImmA (M78 family)